MKPRTEKQRATSRLNGARSRGPVTARGKYISSQNATRHGLLARTLVLECETEIAFLCMLDALKEEYQPLTTTEVILVETMAAARWRILRIKGAQKTFLDRSVSQLDPCLGDFTVRLSQAMQGQDPDPQDRFLRHEAIHERTFHRALKTLRAMQAGRNEQPPFVPAQPPPETIKIQKRTPQAKQITSPQLDLPRGYKLPPLLPPEEDLPTSPPPTSLKPNM